MYLINVCIMTVYLYQTACVKVAVTPALERVLEHWKSQAEWHLQFHNTYNAETSQLQK